MRRIVSCSTLFGAFALLSSAATVADDGGSLVPLGGPTQFVGYITTGLSSPVLVTHANDGSDRIFIVQQGGAIRVAHGSTLNATAFLTLNGTTTCRPGAGQTATTVGLSAGGERGLLSMAFHPDFATNGQFFVSFNDTNSDSMIARYTMADPDADVLSANDIATCTVVLRVDQDASNHKGGHLAFGPDGFLYIGFGDGGGGGASPGDTGGNDGCNRAQTLNPANLSSTNNCAVDANFTSTGGDGNSRALLGKMLRIDVDGTTPAATPGLCGQANTAFASIYAIPDEDAGTPGNQGNPFADGSTVNGCDEVWSYGLRNPWRWSFDRSTSDLIIADVGQGGAEEVDFEPPSTEGRNYGWKCFEGNNAVNGCSPAPANTTFPIITYSHSGGRCSITGGYRYRGPVTTVQGQYFYGDFCSNQVWASIETGGSWSQPGTAFQTVEGGVRGFGEDEIGNLYLARGSQIWILDGPAALPDPLFMDGFE
jgi:glucose/arabinose dehydrogenase